MTAFRLMIGILWLVMVLQGLMMWRASATVSPRPVTRVYTAAQPRPDARNSASDERRDLYGNEIDEAVGDYRVDPAGELYERHNPDTAVLKLGPQGV